MLAKEDIRQVVEPKIKELGGFFVDLKVTPTNVISLFFDREDGVHVDHCLEISRYIEECFDRDKEDYELTVCSAGLDKPFKVEEQYHKYKGKEVGVLLKDGIRHKGVILSFEKEVLTLQILKKKKGTKKKYITTELAIPHIQIKETKLKIKWK